MPVATDDSSCVYVPQFWGMPADQLAATAANICIAVIGLLSLVYYGAHAYLSTCGWEEVYVCIVECELGSAAVQGSIAHTLDGLTYGSSSACSLLVLYPEKCGLSSLFVMHLHAVIKVFAEVFLEYCVPVTFNEINGNHIVWIRYCLLGPLMCVWGLLSTDRQEGASQGGGLLPSVPADIAAQTLKTAHVLGLPLFVLHVTFQTARVHDACTAPAGMPSGC